MLGLFNEYQFCWNPAVYFNSPFGLITCIYHIYLDLLDESQTKLSSDLLDSRESISQIQVHVHGKIWINYTSLSFYTVSDASERLLYELLL